MPQYALSKQQKRFRINKQVNKIKAKTCVLPENFENHADMCSNPHKRRVEPASNKKESGNDSNSLASLLATGLQ